MENDALKTVQNDLLYSNKKVSLFEIGENIT